MNVYRNKLTGAVIEIASEFGNDKVWEKISPAPVAKAVKAEPKEVAKPKAEAPKKATTAKKAVKK
jgi:hypothetical protein